MVITPDNFRKIMSQFPKKEFDEIYQKKSKLGHASVSHHFGDKKTIIDQIHKFDKTRPNQKNGMKDGPEYKYVVIKFKSDAKITPEEAFDFANDTISSIVGYQLEPTDFFMLGKRRAWTGTHPHDYIGWRDPQLGFKKDETPWDYYAVEFTVSDDKKLEGEPSDDGTTDYDEIDESVESKDGDDYYECRFPTWALDYVVNAEKGGLEKDEIEMVDDFFEELEKSGFDPHLADYGTEEYYSNSPEFGLPGQVVDAKFVKKDAVSGDDGEPWVDDKGYVTKKIPQKAIDDCTVGGRDALPYVQNWIDKLGFDKDFPVEIGKSYIKASGGWDEDEISKMSGNDVVTKVFWLICGTLADDPSLNGNYSIGDYMYESANSASTTKVETVADLMNLLKGFDPSKKVVFHTNIEDFLFNKVTGGKDKVEIHFDESCGDDKKEKVDEVKATEVGRDYGTFSQNSDDDVDDPSDLANWIRHLTNGAEMGELMFWYKDELLDLERLQAQDNGIHFYLKDHVVGETKENSAGEDKKSEAEQLKSEIKKEFGLKECGTTKEQEAEQLNETNTSFQTCKTWTNGKDLIYRTIGDLTKGIVEDGDWSHVSELFKKIEDLGGSVSYSAKNGMSENGSVFRNGYMFTKDSDRPSAKVYEFTVDFTNQEGNQVLIDGELTCSFAGKEDEFIPDKYDMSVVMWKGREEA